MRIHSQVSFAAVSNSVLPTARARFFFLYFLLVLLFGVAALFLDSSRLDTVERWAGGWYHDGSRQTRASSSSCGVDDTLRQVYAEHMFRLSRVHEGSGYRVQEVLKKAARGEQITIALLGGSVSTGHGAIPGVGPHQYGAIAFDNQWHQFVMRYLRSTYQNVIFKNGARPAVDSSYFAWCYTTYIDTDADLVMIEMAVNDENTETSAVASEELLRSILQLPNSPAVIYVDSFALRTKSGRGGMTNGADAHDFLSNFYDVPQISIRNPLLPELLRNASLAQPFFNGDGRHIAAPLHEMLGDMVVGYLQEEHCRVVKNQPLGPELLRTENELWPGRSSLGIVPKLPTWANWNDQTTYPVNPPLCKVAGSTMLPSKPTAFTLTSWKDEKFYWEGGWDSSTPDPVVTFDIEVKPGALGEIAIGYLRSHQYNLGKAICSVAGQSVTLDGTWKRKVSLAQTATIAQKLSPGMYEVKCRVLAPQAVRGGGNKTFRLMSVMSL